MRLASISEQTTGSFRLKSTQEVWSDHFPVNMDLDSLLC